jgi:hypothetical protein
MTDDLLTRIQREMHERLRELRRAVDERDQLAADLRALEAEHLPEASSPRLAPGCEPSRTRAVSPKVVRLMSVPQRPPLERSRRPAAAQAGADRIDPFPEEGPVEEIDADAECYEHSI